MLPTALKRIAEILPEKFDIRVITYLKATGEILVEGFEKGNDKIKKLYFFGDNGRLKRDYNRAVKVDDLSEQNRLSL